MDVLYQREHLSLAKRVFDVVISLAMLLFIFPVMIVFAVLVKLDSRGPIFYRQKRVGMNNRTGGRRARPTRRNQPRQDGDSHGGRRHDEDRRESDIYGRPFEVLKFRTMVVESEKDGRPVWCQVDDPRVTRVGRFLRKTHLDELPQLINILKGEMSIVGPRPERPEFVVELTDQIPEYKQRLVVKPGLTGLAQIRHRADQVIDDVKKKIRYDFLYMRKASLSTDFMIILGTIPLVLGGSMYAFKRLKKARRFLSIRNVLGIRRIRRPLFDGTLLHPEKREIVTNGKPS